MKKSFIIIAAAASVISSSVFADRGGPPQMQPQMDVTSYLVAGSVGGSVVGTAGGSQSIGNGIAGTASGVSSKQMGWAGASFKEGSLKTYQGNVNEVEGYSMTGSLGNAAAGSDYFGYAGGLSGAGGLVISTPSRGYGRD